MNKTEYRLPKLNDPLCDTNLNSLKFTYKIQENLNKLENQINFKHNPNDNDNDGKNEPVLNQQKPFILKFIEHQNRLCRNTASHKRIKKYSMEKKKLPIVECMQCSLTNVPKTKTPKEISHNDKTSQNNSEKLDGRHSEKDSANSPKTVTESIRITFGDANINECVKTVSYLNKKPMKREEMVLSTHQGGLNINPQKRTSENNKSDPIDDTVDSQYKEGDFVTTGIKGHRKLDLNLLKSQRATVERIRPTSGSGKPPGCLNTTKMCCQLGTREPSDPWFSLDHLIMRDTGSKPKLSTFLKRKKFNSCSLENINSTEVFPLKCETISHNSLPNLKYQTSGDLVVIQNYSSLLDELTCQRKLVLKYIGNYNKSEQITFPAEESALYKKDNQKEGINKLSTCAEDHCPTPLKHIINEEKVEETNCHVKEINLPVIQNKFRHRHFNPEIYYDLNISVDHFIELSQRDVEKCIENEISRMRIAVGENDEYAHWRIVVNKLPTDIKPILKYFKSNIQKEQYINFKLIADEIARLTHAINTNPSNKSGFDLCRRGALYRKIGRLQAAKIDLVKSIEYEPNLSSAHWHIHFIHLLEGKLEEALNDLNQCMKCLNTFNLNNDTTIKGSVSSRRKYSKKAHQFYENILHSKAFIYSLMNNWKLEAEVWTNLIQLNPTYELAYLKRAHAYLKLKMFQHSNTDFIKVLCLNPKSVEAQFQCGLYKYYNSNWRRAVDYFQEVLMNNPTHFRAHYYMARSLIKLYKYDIALAELTACLYFEPMYYKALYTRGCLLANVDPLQSLRDLTMCICVGSKKYQSLAFIQRGLQFYQIKKYTMAIHDFQSALHNGHQQCFDVYRLLGLSYIRMKLWTRAIQILTAAIKVLDKPNDIVNILLCRAEVYSSQGQNAKAIMDVQRVLHMNSNKAEYYLLLGSYLFQHSDIQLVQRCVQHYLRILESQNYKQVKQMALSYYFLGRYTEADLVLLTNQNQHQSDMECILLHALTLEKLQRTKDSVSLLETTLKKLFNRRISERAQIYDHLGQYYMKLKKYSSAVDSFTRSIHLNSEQPHVYLYRAQSNLHLIILQRKGKSNYLKDLSNGINDNVLNDISQALVLLTSKSKSISEIYFYAPFEVVNLFDLCLLTRVAYFGLYQRYTKAILNCNEAISRRPEWTRMWINRGVFKYLLKTYDFSESDLNMAVKTDNCCPLAYYNRGLCHQTQNNWNEAIEDYGLSIKYGASHGCIHLQSLINRSLLYLEKFQNYESAIADLCNAKTILEAMIEKLQQKDNDNISRSSCTHAGNSTIYNASLRIKIMHTLGICHQKLEHYVEAEQIFRHLTLSEPGFLQGHIGRANCLMDYGGYMIKTNLGDSKSLWEEALVVYEFANRLDEFNLEASIGLSMCLQVLGRLNDALKQITHSLDIYYNKQQSGGGGDEIINRGQNSSQCSNVLLANAHDCRAIIYLQLGRPQRAIDDLTVSIRLNRYATKYLINRGVAYLINNQSMPAMIDFRKAIQIDPKNSLANYHRALIYLHHSQFEQAENAVNIALQEQCLPFNCYQLDPMNLDPSVWLLRSIIHLLKYKSNDTRSRILQEALNDVCKAEELISPRRMHYSITQWPHLHYTKGRILYELNCYKDAEEEYTKALRLLPYNQFIYEARCQCRQQMYRVGLINSYQEALTDYRLSLLASTVTTQ